jgi:hypothetical protein
MPMFRRKILSPSSGLLHYHKLYSGKISEGEIVVHIMMINRYSAGGTEDNKDITGAVCGA